MLTSQLLDHGQETFWTEFTKMYNISITLTDSSTKPAMDQKSDSGADLEATYFRPEMLLL